MWFDQRVEKVTLCLTTGLAFGQHCSRNEDCADYMMCSKTALSPPACSCIQGFIITSSMSCGEWCIFMCYFPQLLVKIFLVWFYEADLKRMKKFNCKMQDLLPLVIWNHICCNGSPVYFSSLVVTNLSIQLIFKMLSGWLTRKIYFYPCILSKHV